MVRFTLFSHYSPGYSCPVALIDSRNHKWEKMEVGEGEGGKDNTERLLALWSDNHADLISREFIIGDKKMARVHTKTHTNTHSPTES